MPRKPAKPRRAFVRGDEVLKAAGVTYMTMRDWIRRGILPPPLESVTGRGNVARYDRSALLRAELARKLRDDGWPLDEIAKHMQAQKWNKGTPS